MAKSTKRVTAGVRDMLAIIESSDATEDEKSAAAATIVEAVAPEIMEKAYPDPVETARRLGPQIAAHDFKRIAGALGLAESEETTIDQMVKRILALRATIANA